MLLTTVSISFITQLALVYVGFMQAIFQTDSLAGRDLGIILALGATSFALHELRRWYERKIDAEDTYVAVMEDLA